MIINTDTQPKLLAMWNSWLENNKAGADMRLARIIEQKHHQYICLTAVPGADESGAIQEHSFSGEEEFLARIGGNFESGDRHREDYPVVGDWAVIQPRDDLNSGDGERRGGIIVDLLPRESSLNRAAAGGKTEKQIIVANLDYLLLVFGLDGGRNFLLSMLERSLTVAWNSGAKPVIVLNKVDCADEVYRREARETAEAVAFGVPVHLVSAHSGEGMEDLAEQLPPGATVAMLGKSGVGKSALVNALYHSEVAAEGRQRRGDNQGRHTTTHSRLYQLPRGAWIADVPGLRELKIWGDDEDLAQAFPDIEALAENCRFRDCCHDGEPGCAVLQALDSGEIEQRRFESYIKLQREIRYIERRQDEQAVRDERQKWKAVTKSMRHFKKPGR